MSTTLFFYGSLCHIPLLEVVLGRVQGRIDIRPAHLNDHLVSWVKDEPFPMIAEKTRYQAQGILVQYLSDEDVARLRFYEGGFDYDLKTVSVICNGDAISAEVFFPEACLWSAGAEWNLQDWITQWGTVSLSAAGEVMEHYGVKSGQEIAHLLPFFRARGWAKVLAKTSMDLELRCETQRGAVTLQPRSDGYAGFFRLESFNISHPRFDGTQSEALDRVAFVGYDAALVLPYDPKRDLVLLIEQLRYGPVLRGDPQPWVLEPVAGLVDAGEAPMEAARREAFEEAGLDLQDIRPMMNVYPSPGYSTEFFHCFLAVCDLDVGLEKVHESQSESEDIRKHVVSFDRAMELLDSGEINSTLR